MRRYFFMIDLESVLTTSVFYVFNIILLYVFLLKILFILFNPYEINLVLFSYDFYIKLPTTHLFL